VKPRTSQTGLLGPEPLDWSGHNQKPEAAGDAALCVDGVSPGRISPGLQHGTRLETAISRLQTELEDRFSGRKRAPQKAEYPEAAGDKPFKTQIPKPVKP